MALVTFDPTSSTPKYQQIINSILEAINTNKLKIGDKIPSVNEVSEATGLAKKTVVQAFEQLKQTGVIDAVRYKGYFVASANTHSRQNVFVLFNGLTVYKEEIYESIKTALGNHGVVDMFFHHDNLEVFNTLVEQNVGKYTHYLIIPVNHPDGLPTLQKLPADKVYILDLGYTDWGTQYPSVCQNFEEDLYRTLTAEAAKVRQYTKVILVTGPAFLNLPQINKGFLRFCEEQALEQETIPNTRNRVPVPGELYVIVDDQDLVRLVKAVAAAGLALGQEVGILSYNEIPFKEITANGISTISTDFTQMGQEIVQLMLQRKKAHVQNPSRLIRRNSF